MKPADFSANFDFLPCENPAKLADFPREFAPENPAKFNLFFHDLSEALIQIFITNKIKMDPSLLEEKWDLHMLIFFSICH